MERTNHRETRFHWQMAKGTVVCWPKMPIPKAQNGVWIITLSRHSQDKRWTTSSSSTILKKHRATICHNSYEASYRWLATTTVSDRDAIMERCSILFTSCPSTAAASAFARIVKMFALGVAVVMMVLDQHCRKNAFPSQVQSDDKSFTFPDARVNMQSD